MFHFTFNVMFHLYYVLQRSISCFFPELWIQSSAAAVYLGPPAIHQRLSDRFLLPFLKHSNSRSIWWSLVHIFNARHTISFMDGILSQQKGSVAQHNDSHNNERMSADCFSSWLWKYPVVCVSSTYSDSSPKVEVHPALVLLGSLTCFCENCFSLLLDAWFSGHNSCLE